MWNRAAEVGGYQVTGRVTGARVIRPVFHSTAVSGTASRRFGRRRSRVAAGLMRITGNSPDSIPESPHPEHSGGLLESSKRSGTPPMLTVSKPQPGGVPVHAHMGRRCGSARTARAGLVDLGHRPPSGA